MARMAAVTRRFVDTESADSVSTRLRQRRWLRLAERFPDLNAMRVLDLGGTAESWRLCPVQPAHLTLLNTFDQGADGPNVVVGDACNPPASLHSQHFDLIYSNSVIEHVGGHFRRERFAEVVHALGDHYWIQTPNRLFPIEPHFLCPMLQFLPLPLAARVASRWPVGHFAGKITSRNAAERDIQEIELIGMAQMQFYFPSAEVLRERFGPLTKSMIACR